MPASSVGAPPSRRGFAVVDVETSGLDPLRHRVIEVAVTQLTPSGAVEREWSTLVRAPGGTGPEHIHGLSTADTAQAPEFRDVVDELSDLLDGRILVAHNAAFDWSFLAAEARRAHVRLPVQERLCTWHLARALDLPTQNLRLGTLAEHWGIPVENAHRAGDDVRVLVDVLRHCLNEAGRTGTPLTMEDCAPMPLLWRTQVRWGRLRKSVRRKMRQRRRRAQLST